jgi:hypothetical protein
MKSTVSIVLLFLSIHCIGQTRRDYFFDELTIDDSTSLVLIIQEPQTQFARELKNRIYKDTTFLRELKENWFTERTDSGIGSTTHRCGHDLYFYKLSGTEYTYLNQLNSNCGITEVGCTNLNVLAQSGKPLRADTVSRLRMTARKTDLFTDDVFRAYYTADRHYWEYCKTSKFPPMFYEGYFKTTIQLDTNFTINENAEKFIRTFTDDIEGINWNIYDASKAYPNKLKDFENKKEPCTTKISIYLKKQKFIEFKAFEIIPIAFNIKWGSDLILMYRD